MEQSNASVGSRAAFIAALLILLLAVSVLIIAQDYTGGSGVYPRFVGWIFVGLSLMELIIQIKAMLTTGSADSGVSADQRYYKELKGLLWVCVFPVLLYLTGFMAGIPLYMFAFLYLSAQRPLIQCVIFSALSVAFIYALFVGLLDYRLYAGVLFGA
jgi:hypothetical protein